MVLMMKNFWGFTEKSDFLGEGRFTKNQYMHTTIYIIYTYIQYIVYVYIYIYIIYIYIYIYIFIYIYIYIHIFITWYN